MGRFLWAFLRVIALDLLCFCQAFEYALQACSLRINWEGERLNSCWIFFTFFDTNCLEHFLCLAISVSDGGSPMPKAMRTHLAWNRTSGFSDSCIAITTRLTTSWTSSSVYVR